MGFSIRGILQTRILQRVAISFSKSTYILKQNRNGHMSMCCLKSFMSLIISLKKNIEEWAGFGSEFGITKHCFSVPCHGVWLMDLNFLQWQIHKSSLTHVQSVCLSAEHAAQFLFHKYIVKDPRTKLGTLYTNKYGKKEVGFFGGILKLNNPLRAWGFLWHNI